MVASRTLRDRLRDLVLEAHRRSLGQVLGLYAVLSWIAYEVILALTEGLGLPEWVPPFALVLFIVGLPLVVATAFVHEGMAGPAPPGPADPEPGASPDRPAAVEAAGPSPGQRRRGGDRPPSPLTWRRVGVAGVLAFAALGLAAGGFMGMRSLGIGPVGTLVARGELDAREPLVVADFQALSGDSTLAVVVTEGLRADLAQSSFVTVADRARVRETLDRMLRPAGTRLDPPTAREVALRMGLKAVVEGEIGRAGAGYLLTARVVTADSAVTLAAFRETAVDSTRLLAAIEGLSRSLRERVGESLRAVRASVPLAQVTTPSLPALRRFAAASAEERAGNRPRAIRLLDEAVEMDPGFATAWHSLAILHYNSDAREAVLRAMERALEHQDRLDDARRHRARAFYASITGDHRAAEIEERELLTLTPDDPVPHISLSDMAWNRGDWAEAEAHARRALERGSESWVAHWNLVVALLDAGRAEDARHAAEAARQALPEDLDIPRQLIDMTLAAGSRYDSIRLRAGTPPVRIAHADRVLGRWDEAEALLRAAAADGVGQSRWWRTWDRMIVLGDPDAADAIEEAIDTVIGVRDDFPERPIAEVALAMAMAGRPAAAQRARARYEERVPEPVRWADAYLLHAIDGFLALDEGRIEDALSALRRARASTPWTAPVDAFLGRAYDLVGRPDSAVAAYERYLDTPWAYRIGFFHSFADPVLLVPVHERLAFLHDELGDRAAAARHAAAVLALWDGADPVLERRVSAVRRLLERPGE